MNTALAQWFTRHERGIDWAFAVFFLTLLAYSLLRLFGMLPGGPGFQPRRFAVMTAAAALQPLGALVRRRSVATFRALLLLSLGLMIVSLTMGS